MSRPTPDPRSARDVRNRAMPRWVKAFGLVAAVLAVLFVVAHFTGVVPTGAHG